jgi:membrane-bound lytic murein transglycosylase D
MRRAGQLLARVILCASIGAAAGCATTTPQATDEPPAAPPVPVAVPPPATPTLPPDVVRSEQPADPVAAVIESLPAPTVPPPELIAEPARSDLWERIRAGFKMPDLETRIAEQRTRWYAEQPDYLARMVQRSSRYLYHIVEEIERRDMPTELALLPFVESAFQPQAVSSAKAAGLWQFIPSTGLNYELTQNMWKDERRGVIESTRAALDYLQKLHDMFGDWHLALAAYNWGEGAVSRAIARNQREKKPTTYTALRMPQETQHYVPKLQAMKNIVSDPDKHGVTLPPISNSPYFVAVLKTFDIDLETAARLAEMEPADFRALNPAFNRPLIVGASNSHLLLPADKVDRYHANLAAWHATGQPLASWTVYTLKPADTLAAVARRVGLTEQALREANDIPPRYRLRPGSTILIPRDETMAEDIPAASLEARFSLVPESANLRKVTYRVRRGDTLASVARRWRVDQKDIIVWNRLTAPKLFVGQRLELTVARPAPRRPTATAKKPTATKRAAAKAPARSAASAQSPVRASVTR